MAAILEVCFRNLPPSAALEAAARRRFEHLARRYRKLASGAITIDAPHRHRHSGRPFVVHLRLRIPGSVIAISHDDDRPGHVDPYVALSDAFEAAGRRLDAILGSQRDTRRGPRLQLGHISFPSLVSRLLGNPRLH